MDHLQFFLDLGDHVFGVFTETDDHDAADYLALAVAFGHATPQFRPQADEGYIPDKNGIPGYRADDDTFDVGNTFKITPAPAPCTRFRPFR